MTSLRHNEVEAIPPRELYLDAARASIVDVGWRRTTLTGVARRAGVSRMTLYRTWPDMPALLADLLTREAAALTARALVDAPDSGAPTASGLVEQVLAIIGALRRDDFFARIVALDPDLLLPYLLQRRGRAQQHLLDLLVERIRAGQRAGAVRRGEPQAMARALVLAAHGFVLSTQTMTDDLVSATALEDELRLLLTRLLAL